jgi:hypothetical protein
MVKFAPPTLVALPPSAEVKDVSGDGNYISYTVASGGAQTLYVLNLKNGATTTVISVPGTGVSGETGIDGGQLPSDGHYIIYGTGKVGSGYSTGNHTDHLFVKDLRSNAAATDVTPSFPEKVFPPGSSFPNAPGTALGLEPDGVSDDGRHILYGAWFVDFVGDESFEGVVVGDTVTGAKARFNTINKDQAELSPNGQYVTYTALPTFNFEDVRNHTGITARNSDNEDLVTPSPSACRGSRPPAIRSAPAACSPARRSRPPAPSVCRRRPRTAGPSGLRHAGPYSPSR